MALKTFGTMAVDWEERVNFDRLRRERLARIKALLKKSEIGALLCFDMNNIRYITNTTIGTWAVDKLGRYCLLPQDDDPINWDFGSAAKHHALYCPWLGEGRSRAGISTLRGAVPPDPGFPDRRAFAGIGLIDNMEVCYVQCFQDRPGWRSNARGIQESQQRLP